MSLNLSKLAVPALIALLVLAGCGGSSSSSKTATTASKPLSQADLDLADRSVKSLASTVTTYLVKVNHCAQSKRRARCVKAVVKPAEAAVNRTRTTLTALQRKSAGSCANQLASLSSSLTELTGTLGPLAQATLQGGSTSTVRLGTDAQNGLRTFAGSSVLVQQACIG
jgi:hypothetical protein